MQDYIERAETPFSYRYLKVVSMRTDNGTEFCNSELKNLFDDQGISHERSVPYNSHQHCVAGRLHRTIQDKARVLLAAAFFVNRLLSPTKRVIPLHYHHYTGCGCCICSFVRQCTSTHSLIWQKNRYLEIGLQFLLPPPTLSSPLLVSSLIPSINTFI